MENNWRRLEDLVEQSLDKVTANPTFLGVVATAININSYRKIWMRKSLEALWRDLELPVRRDQDRLISSVEQLSIRLKRMEMDLAQAQAQVNSKSDVRPVRRRPLPQVNKEVEFQ